MAGAVLVGGWWGMSSEYQIWLKTPTGVPLAILDRFISLELIRSVNSTGTLKLVLPWGAYPINYFADDTIFEVWRSVDGGLPYLEGETIFFQEYIAKKTSADGLRTLEIEALDPLFLIDQHIVAYNSNTPQTEKNGLADDVIKQIVKENLGNLATDATRNIPLLAVQGNLSQGPQMSKSIAHRPLDNVLKEIVQDAFIKGTYLAYDIVSLVPVSSVSLEFRTYLNYRGMDRRWPTSTKPLMLDPDLGQLTEVERAYDRRDLHNVIYAGGRGKETQRVVATAIDSAAVSASPWARRETWIDARNTADPNAVQAEANQELRAKRAKKTFSARMTDTASVKYGRDYRFGDFITTVFDGETLDARVDAIRLSVQSGQETINAVLRSDA